jgi:hypothetical protein
MRAFIRARMNAGTFAGRPNKPTADMAHDARAISGACRQLGLDAVFLMGPQSGALALALRHAGIHAVVEERFSTPATGRSVQRWLLDRDFVTAARAAIDRGIGDKEHLVACVDALGHLELEDVALALVHLREVSKQHALLSFRGPSDGAYDAGPAGWIPRSTWNEMLAAVGFDLVTAEPAAGSTTRFSAFSFGRWLASRSGRVAGRARTNEPASFLLRKARDPEQAAAIASGERMLDLSYRRKKRQHFAAAPVRRVGFNVVLFQDFVNLRPLLDVLDSAEVVVLLRRGSLRADALLAVQQILQRREIATVEFDLAREIDWRSINLDMLFSVTEGSWHVVHALGRQVVEAANINGVRTWVLQHGIRVELFADRVLQFGSDLHLTWGGEQQEFLNSTHPVAGVPVAAGVAAGGHDRALGSPKYSDSVIDPNADALRFRLGVDTRRYQRVVLLGTNMRWGAHRKDRRTIMDAMLRTVTTNDDLLFVVKVHPAERVAEYAALQRPNVVLLDDVILARMDFSLARIVNCVDIVVSSLSTLLLDAAVAGKPYLLYDTGNDYAYRFCEPIELDALPQAVRDWPREKNVSSSEFRAHYAGAEDGQFYQRLAEELSTPPPHKTPTDASLVAYSLCSIVEELWHQRRTSGGI